MRQRPAEPARRQVRRVHRLLQLSRVQIYAAVRAVRRRRRTEPAELGNGIELKVGRFGPYLERDGKRASLPKDVPQDS